MKMPELSYPQACSLVREEGDRLAWAESGLSDLIKHGMPVVPEYRELIVSLRIHYANWIEWLRTTFADYECPFLLEAEKYDITLIQGSWQNGKRWAKIGGRWTVA